jgi:hypothetical protein
LFRRGLEIWDTIRFPSPAWLGINFVIEALTTHSRANSGRRAPSCLHLTLPSVFLRVFSMLSARLLVPSVHDDDLRCFLVV